MLAQKLTDLIKNKNHVMLVKSFSVRHMGKRHVCASASRLKTKKNKKKQHLMASTSTPDKYTFYYTNANKPVGLRAGNTHYKYSSDKRMPMAIQATALQIRGYMITCLKSKWAGRGREGTRGMGRQKEQGAKEQDLSCTFDKHLARTMVGDQGELFKSERVVQEEDGGSYTASFL